MESAPETQATTVTPARTEVAAPTCIQLHIPVITFIKIAAVLLVTYSIFVLWSLLLLVFLALFLAVTLYAFVDWLDANGMRHWASLLLVIGGLLAVVGLGLALILPELMDQATSFTTNLPQLRETALNLLPAGGGVRLNAQHLMENSEWTEAGNWFNHFMSAGGVALDGIAEISLLLVISLYLLIDGSKTYEWLLAFFSPLKRSKIRLTSKEISKVIFGYVAGQVITSALVMIFSFIVLAVLQVPAALMLAILAGVFDILPILGFIIATVPAFLLALSVSPQTAFIVLGFYVLFQALENYLIVPLVYGK